VTQSLSALNASKLTWLSDMTHFIAADLVFVQGSLAATLIMVALSHRSRLTTFHWAIRATLVLTLSFVLALIGTTVYFLPPVGYSGPITPGIPNSFPSHHALLATAIAALVFLLDPWWSAPFALTAIVIDGALVKEQGHHVIDVAASSSFVVIATILTLLIAPRIARWLIPSVALLSETFEAREGANDEGALAAIEALRVEVLNAMQRQEAREAAILQEVERLRQLLQRQVPE
jgi:membrane-associated phospholipid phosphatase